MHYDSDDDFGGFGEDSDGADSSGDEAKGWDGEVEDDPSDRIAHTAFTGASRRLLARSYKAPTATERTDQCLTPCRSSVHKPEDSLPPLKPRTLAFERLARHLRDPERWLQTLELIAAPSRTSQLTTMYVPALRFATVPITAASVCRRAAGARGCSTPQLGSSARRGNAADRCSP